MLTNASSLLHPRMAEEPKESVPKTSSRSHWCHPLGYILRRPCLCIMSHLNCSNMGLCYDTGPTAEPYCCICYKSKIEACYERAGARSTRSSLSFSRRNVVTRLENSHSWRMMWMCSPPQSRDICQCLSPVLQVPSPVVSNNSRS